MIAIQPRFITLEGTEGVGKTTNLTFIAEYLQANGIDFIQTREPGGTPLGEGLRSLLLADYLTPVVPEVELLMMFASRAQHVHEVIKPALAAGQWVLSDRFVDASFAYQGGGRCIPLDRIAYLESWLLGDFKADHCFILDAPIAVGRSRQSTRADADRIEKEADRFFERVRGVYLDRATDSKRYTLVDATLPLEEVQAQLQTRLDQLVASARL